MKHGIVYSEPGIYAGWPANHGAWQWGDEFLVGFLRGRYGNKSMHKILEPFQKVLARSLDGGATWKLEIPNLDFDCHEREIPAEAPEFSLSQNIIRVCGVYDHGGDECYGPGGFYKSSDRGHTWDGPYRFTGLEHHVDVGDMINTSRTRIVGNLLFMSRGQNMIWGTDEVFVAVHDGERFHYIADVLNDACRAVMPAVALTGRRLVAVMRRRRGGARDGWIDAVHSDDGGLTWSAPRMVGATGGRNGNPPALITLLDGRLCCAYGNRDFGSIVAAISDDGEHWESTIVRDGSEKFLDIGYPQLFLRSDGVPVCVYYWADANRWKQHIAYSVLDDLK